MLLMDCIKLMSAKTNAIVYDNFNRENNSSSAGNAVTGQLWDISLCKSATWGIIDQTLYCSSNSSATGIPTILIEDGVVGKKITVDVTLYGQVSIIFRVNNTANFFVCTLQTDLLRVRRVIDKTWSTVVQQNVKYKEGVTYRLSITDTGTIISVSMNDSLMMTATDTGLNTYTNAGIRLGSATNLKPRFDNYMVELL